MAKKPEQNTNESLAKIELTKEQETMIKALDADERERFDNLDEDGQRELLELISDMETDAQALAGQVVSEEVSVSGGMDESDCTILAPGSFGLKEGTRIIARYMGVVPLISKEEKENWPTIDIEGEKYYTNMFYKFARTNGKEFGIFDSPTLRILRKVVTNSATPALVEKDPIVTLLYHGKFPKEVAEKEYGIKLKKGTHAHIFNVSFEKGTKYDRFQKGVLCYLRNPLPTKSANENISDVELARRNWEAIQTANNPQKQIDGGQQQAAIQ